MTTPARKPAGRPHWLLPLALSAGLVGCATDTPAPAPSGGAQSTRVLPTPQQPSSRFDDPLAASELRERALDLLIQMTSSASPQYRGNALEAMAVTPQRLEPLLAPALGDTNVGVRTIAATLIGRLKLASLAAAVRPLLTDTSPYVRASAIYALARCGAEVDQSPLAKLLLGDPAPKVRAHVAVLIGDLGDPSAMGLLHDAVRAPMPRASPVEVRLMQIQVAEAMVKLGDDDQLGAIRAALYPSRPEDLEVTALAVQILGQLRDKGSMDELIYLSARTDESGQLWPAEVRLGVAGALARLGNNRGTFLADQYATNEAPVLRAQAAFVYGQIGKAENLGKLEAMMADPDGLVQLSAAAAVLQIGPRPAGTRVSR